MQLSEKNVLNISIYYFLIKLICIFEIYSKINNLNENLFF